MASGTTHFTHSSHPLFLVQLAGEFICGACKTDGSGPRHRCHLCNFDVHTLCVTCPPGLYHSMHQAHQLKLVASPQKANRVGCICDVCRKEVLGIFYTCCNFNVHPLCVRLPPPASPTPGPASAQLPKSSMVKHVLSGVLETSSVINAGANIEKGVTFLKQQHGGTTVGASAGQPSAGLQTPDVASSVLDGPGANSVDPSWANWTDPWMGLASGAATSVAFPEGGSSVLDGTGADSVDPSWADWANPSTGLESGAATNVAFPEGGSFGLDGPGADSVDPNWADQATDDVADKVGAILDFLSNVFNG